MVDKDTGEVIQDRTKLFGKMAAVMGDINRLAKTGTNKDQHYDYATSEDVKELIRPLLAKHNLAMFLSLPEFEAIDVTSGRGTQGTKIRGRLEFTIACGDTGEMITRSIWMEAIDWQDKAFSKLYTIGEKYFLINTFLISTGDENDPDGDKGEDIKQSKRQPKQQKPSKSNNGNGKKPPDPMTEFWSTCKAYDLTTEQGREILENNDGDPVKALNAIEGHAQ